MGVFGLLRSELQRLIGNKALLFTLIGVLLIPIVYVAVLLSAKWGPYDNMDNLPVAVVNNDTGAVSDGNPIHVGNDLVETLEGSPTLGWHFVSKEEAEAGLEKNDYYMVIEIPEDFSQKVTTVLDANPQTPEIRYIKNEGMNFMASQVTNSAIERIKEQLGDKITATFATTVFGKFPEIAEGFVAGADGSKQILDGTISLSEGSTQILTSLTEKAPDIERLATGAKQADTGAATLLSAVDGGTGDIKRLADGSGQLAQGANQIGTGSSQLETGAKSLGAGASQVLTGLNDLKGGQSQVLGGLQQLQGGAPQVLEGLTSAQTGSATLVTGLQTVQQGTSALDTNLNSIATQVGTLNKSIPTLTGGIDSLGTAAGQLNQLAQAIANANSQLAQSQEFQQLLLLAQGMDTNLQGMKENVSALPQQVETLSGGLTQLAGVATQVNEGVGATVEGSQSLNEGLGQLVAGQTSLVTGIDQLVGGQQQAVAGVDKLVAGQQQVAGGANSLAEGASKLNAGASTFVNGANQVAAGNQQLMTSWTTLRNGIAELKAGTAQISDGNATVATGWNTLTDGVTQLNDGTLRLKDGSQELATALAGGADEVGAVQVSEANIAMFASPVQLVGENVNQYTYYRDSTAPYILSLALFVSMLILSFFIDFKRPATNPSSAISWYISKWLNLALFAVLQALLVSIFVLVVLQLSVTNIPLFILFAIFVSLTFMSIIFFLVAVGNNIGRFIGLAFIVLQLSITGSNLPIPMLPENMQAISKFLPLTYSNAGFKAIISLGDTSLLSSNALILLIFLAIASLLALIVFLFSFKSFSTNINTPEAQA